MIDSVVVSVASEAFSEGFDGNHEKWRDRRELSVSSLVKVPGRDAGLWHVSLEAAEIILGQAVAPAARRNECVGRRDGRMLGRSRWTWDR